VRGPSTTRALINYLRPFAGLLFFLFASINLSAQEVVYFNHLSTADNLTADQFNYYVHRDQYGLVWISSIVGINQFDGQRVKTYQRQLGKANSLLSEVGIQSGVQETPNGDLWFGGAITLYRYNRKTDDFDHFYHTLNGDTLRNYYQWCHLDTTEQLLFSTAGGHLFANDPADFSSPDLVDSCFVPSNGLMLKAGPGRYHLVIPLLSDNRIRVRTYQDLTRVGKPRSLEGPEDIRIRQVLVATDDRLWVASDQGIYLVGIEANDWQKVAKKSPYASLNITGFGKTSLGDLVLGTRSDGLFLYRKDTDQISPILRNDGQNIAPLGEEITHVYVDVKEDVIWVSTKNNGLFYGSLLAGKFGQLKVTAPDGDRNVIALTQDARGSLYLLFANSVAVLSGRDTTFIPLPVSGLGREEPTSIFVDAEEQIWVGTFGHLYQKKKDQSDFQKSNLVPPGRYGKRPGFNGIGQHPNGKLLIKAVFLLLVPIPLP